MFNVKRYFFTLNIELFYNQFPVETISISDGSYSLGFSYPRRFRESPQCWTGLFLSYLPSGIPSDTGDHRL
jgi:hypothetical protein